MPAGVDANLWRIVEDHFRDVMVADGPAEPRQPSVCADGRTMAVTVSMQQNLDGAHPSAVLVVDREGTCTVLRADEPVDLPTFSPVGVRLVVRVGSEGSALAADDGRLAPLPAVHGTIESLRWSPDGQRLLAVVADPGADAAGAQGSGRTVNDRPDWAPHVLGDSSLGGWRRTLVLRVGDDAWRSVSPVGVTTWEAAWCGVDRIVAVCSDGPEEAAWFDAFVGVFDVVDEATTIERSPSIRSIVRPPRGLCVGLPSPSPDGSHVAVVVGSCSDRTVVAGDVWVVSSGDEPSSGEARRLDSGDIDVTSIVWWTDETMTIGGQRGLETVIADVAVRSDVVVERWASTWLTCGQRYPEIAVSPAGTVGIVIEGYGVAAEAFVLDPASEPQRLTSCASGRAQRAAADGGRVQPVRWTSGDGLEIDGLVVVPPGDGPHPMVTYVHGGPIWAWRSRWSMGYPYTLLLARRGYAVLHPNPRGSAGRGERFRRSVLGDLGGAECDDVLSGIDDLVDLGIADPARLGVFGGSHGGFVAARLVTITTRFAACVTYCPVTHWPSMRLTTNDVSAQDHLLAGIGAPNPVDAAGSVTTPTLVLTGSRDLITPPSQGLMFHRALALADVTTEYVEYPLEGHGVRSFPAQIDFSARVLGWFGRFMGVASPPATAP